MERSYSTAKRSSKSFLVDIKSKTKTNPDFYIIAIGSKKLYHKEMQLKVLLNLLSFDKISILLTKNTGNFHKE